MAPPFTVSWEVGGAPKLKVDPPGAGLLSGLFAGRAPNEKGSADEADAADAEAAGAGSPGAALPAGLGAPKLKGAGPAGGAELEFGAAVGGPKLNPLPVVPAAAGAADAGAGFGASVLGAPNVNGAGETLFSFPPALGALLTPLEPGRPLNENPPVEAALGAGSLSLAFAADGAVPD